MTDDEARELTSLRDEIGALREEVRQLRQDAAMWPATQVHHHYPPQAWPGTVVHPGTIPQRQWSTVCAGAADQGLSTYVVNAAACPEVPPFKATTSVAAGCAPVQIYGALS